MFSFFKKQPSQVFEGFYWVRGWKLVPFKIGAVSDSEARKLLSKQSDFQAICSIGVAK